MDSVMTAPARRPGNAAEEGDDLMSAYGGVLVRDLAELRPFALAS